MSVQMARIGTYLDAMKSESVKVNTLDIVEWVKDEPRVDGEMAMISDQRKESLKAA